MKVLKSISSIVVGCCLFSFASVGRGAELWSNSGTWPHSWPEELEQVRKQSTSYGPGPITTTMFYHIPFYERGQFEKVWPGIAKLCRKAGGAKLLDAPECPPSDAKEHSSQFRIAPDAPATVLIIEEDKGWSRGHNAEVGEATGSAKAPPKHPGDGAVGDPDKEINVILFVDGEIIDLNRIRFPSGVALHDERAAVSGEAAGSLKDASAEQP